MMFRLFKWRNQPIRIKSLKELEPGFKPKWFQISFRLTLLGLASMPLIVIGIINELYWMSWLGVTGLGVALIPLVLLEIIPPAMSFVGYWWPWMGLKAAELDSWLERDLDWGG